MTRRRWAIINWIILKWTRKGYASTDYYNLMNFFHENHAMKMCYKCVKKDRWAHIRPRTKVPWCSFSQHQFSKGIATHWYLHIWVFFSLKPFFVLDYFFRLTRKKITLDDMATLEYWIAQTKHILAPGPS